jgi:hypothetical protein
MTERASKWPTLMEQTMGRCKHFNGVQNDACAAGVVYESVRLDHDPLPNAGTSAGKTTRSLPCLARFNPGGATCALATFPTREEAEEREARSTAYLNAVFAARRIIVEQTCGMRGVRGSVECPTCGKRLGFSVASSNGHIHARCETPDCLAWME